MNENDILDTEQSIQDDNLVLESSPDVGTEEIIEEPVIEEPVIEEPVTEDTITEVYEVVDFPEYTIENPMPVMLVEEIEEQTDLEVFSLTGKYYGSISETYLDYFEGIVEKLEPDEHYVIWRSGQYAYNMAYGENIELDGMYFSGDCGSVSIYRSSDSYNSDWYVSFSDDSLALSASDLFVYSDLGMFPTVERGMKHNESSALLFGLAAAFVFVLAHCIFNHFVKYGLRK